MKKKVQYVFIPKTIIRLKTLAARAGKYQSDLLTSLIDEEWERQERERAKSSIPQSQIERGE